jgi:ribosome-associated protein
MKSVTLAGKIAGILDSKKAVDTTVFNVSRFTIVAEYFVVATATSDTHRRALLDEVERTLAVSGIKALRVEGKTAGAWTVADFGGVILHIMSGTSRAEVGLEKLYADAVKPVRRMRSAKNAPKAKVKKKNAKKRSERKNIAKTRG